MANVKKKLKNHSFWMNLLRKHGFFSMKNPEPHEDTMAQKEIRWEGGYLP